MGVLQKSKKHKSLLMNNNITGIIIIDEAGIIKGFNEAAEEITGISPNKCLAKKIGEVIPI
ncbi:MAG: PAS domain-containing protein [Thermodesulfobacteriota bacterium]|nr:PAS domain-containing protein [Thermodesulfobacteriota bacterium]